VTDLRIEIAGEPVRLLAERALYRERNATLYVADLHIGKAATFRAERIAIPHGTTAVTLERLTAAVRTTGAARVVVLGDFYHARVGRHPETTAQLQRWRVKVISLPIMMIRGNHDEHSGDPDEELSITCHDAPVMGEGWTLLHHPARTSAPFWLAGHVHPAVALVGLARQSLFLPCFHLSHNGLVLPSFGEFTGKGEVIPSPGDRVFVIAGDEVVEAKPALRTSGKQ
jgi:DNA ligase-associated metallophosphoesterase